jgi:BlaI family transcriptional regulator, penicillinase repressor
MLYLGSITSVVVTPKPKPHRLGELQLEIMKVLWAGSECSVAQVHEAISRQRDLAYTTIATMLRKMEARGLVAHRAEGRTFLYRAAVDEASVTRNMSGHLLDRLFQGSLADLVSHLLSTREVSKAELAKIEKLIAERKKSK